MKNDEGRKECTCCVHCSMPTNTKKKLVNGKEMYLHAECKAEYLAWLIRCTAQ